MTPSAPMSGAVAASGVDSALGLVGDAEDAIAALGAGAGSDLAPHEVRTTTATAATTTARVLSPVSMAAPFRIMHLRGLSAEVGVRAAGVAEVDLGTPSI
ncbi:MAG TPA: hypothetical protein VIJ11_10010, partial [Galbitalea sp.]